MRDASCEPAGASAPTGSLSFSVGRASGPLVPPDRRRQRPLGRILDATRRRTPVLRRSLRRPRPRRDLPLRSALAARLSRRPRPPRRRGPPVPLDVYRGPGEPSRAGRPDRRVAPTLGQRRSDPTCRPRPDRRGRVTLRRRTALPEGPPQSCRLTARWELAGQAARLGGRTRRPTPRPEFETRTRPLLLPGASGRPEPVRPLHRRSVGREPLWSHAAVGRPGRIPLRLSRKPGTVAGLRSRGGADRPPRRLPGGLLSSRRPLRRRLHPERRPTLACGDQPQVYGLGRDPRAGTATVAPCRASPSLRTDWRGVRATQFPSPPGRGARRAGEGLRLGGENSPAAPPGTLVVGKIILFASARCHLPDLDRWEPEDSPPPFTVPRLGDIPHPGTIFEAGDPVMTLFALGRSPATCRARLRHAHDSWERRMLRVPGGRQDERDRGKA